MPKTFELSIIIPERVVMKAPVTQVTLPTSQGEITVLAGHMPLISAISPGALKVVKDDGSETYMAISTGLIQVDPQGVKILADTAEREDEIDEQRAEAARQRATTLMAQTPNEAEDYGLLAQKIEKELARLKVARRRRPPTPTSPGTPTNPHS
ncbi:MAG: ATP synthase F1 subunit epsilon [Candidatus Hydrogenedentes bacterium]|nr:ATP synthase F1 subunit epsilon [Candidatus Hydrogenedentota bacterium]